MPAAIPPRLRDLLGGSAYEAGILELSGACGEILTDNKMPFFPAFTDHGGDHVSAVLNAAERLIPESAWESGLLEPADAAVLIGAGFLHDLALHIREPGFLALVADDSAFKPLPWFDLDQPNRPADAPWADLWQAFRREARYLSKSQLDRILGPPGAEVPRIAFGDADTTPGDWTDGDRLLIGEFLRRHHARLSHEMAIYGFPGIDAREFPVLGDTLPTIANAIGVVARSHNEDMRTAAEYLQYRGSGDLRPDGAAQLYLMGLLRIADYFQLQANRASPLLLHLREPQSPQSVMEWGKHQAIEAISWEHRDPGAVSIQVSATHNLATHLQLAELIGDLQKELDVTTAVLSETYGSSGLAPLELGLQRVRTNLFEPSLHDRLSFVPRRARMRSAEDLFRLVVSGLYGNVPPVAGRELLQNAVDAVRDLERWQAKTDGTREVKTRDLPADVLIEVEAVDGGSGLLRVADRGIGMSPSTVIESFLTAGATFRTPLAEEDDLDPMTAIKWMKAGRFGIGVFASFLLGSEVRVTTRHAAERRGVSFVARMDDDLVQLNWADDVPVGTEIVIPFSGETLPDPYKWDGNPLKKLTPFVKRIASFYKLSSPRVSYRIISDGAVHEIDVVGEVPTPGGRLPDEWRSVTVPDFDAILWRVPPPMYDTHAFRSIHVNDLAHNGIAIEKVNNMASRVYEWNDLMAGEVLSPPSVAVFDTQQRLGVALNRYELTDRSLPFEDALLESIGTDIVAHALACGPRVHPLAHSWGLQPVVGREHWLPLLPGLVDRYVDGDLCVLWISEPTDRSVTERFLSELAKDTRWKRLPFRIALEPANSFSELLEEERLEWGFAYDEVVPAVEWIAETLHREPIAGTYIRSTGLSIETKDIDGIPGVDSGSPGLGQLLVEVGEELAQYADLEALALTVLRGHANLEPRQEVAATPWISTIAGPLERETSALLSRKREIVERDQSLQALVSKWERLSQARNSDR